MTDRSGGAGGPAAPAGRRAGTGTVAGAESPWPVAVRLALAFVSVALAAVALLAGLTAALAAADVAHLTNQQRTKLTGAIAASAGTAYARAGGWARADLSPVLAVASAAGARVQIRDRAGQVVSASPGFPAGARRPQVSAVITVRGGRVGLAAAWFTGSSFGAANHSLLTDLLQAILGAAGLAALLALLAGLAAARRITRPVGRLIAVTRAMARGDRSARAGPVRAPRELSELAATFDQMAGTLEREEQLRRDLVADVAHELRTPLAVLQASHEALADGIAQPTGSQLASLRDEVLRLSRMVGDLQTLAEANEAALHLAVRRTDLAVVAAAAADSLAGRFEAAGVTVTRRLQPVTVLADAGRLHQIITNLLTNALKFTASGGRVTIRAGPSGKDAVLQVTDTGTGIPAGELPLVFDRFWRGQGAARVSGQGIGLAVAAGLSRAHGGELTAASTEGRGTQMTLTLPRV